MECRRWMGELCSKEVDGAFVLSLWGGHSLGIVFEGSVEW
jgi:hypothetical protein